MNYQAMKKQELIEKIAALEKKNRKLEHAESELRQAKKKIISSEEKFRALAESSAFAIMMHQGDKWIYANSAAQEISGYTAEELYRMNFWEFVYPDHQERVKQGGYKHQQGKILPRAYEFKIIAKNGVEKLVILNGNAIKYEDKPTALISVTDITESKRANDALRESEENYRNIFENANEAIFVAQDGKVVFHNPMAAKLTGFLREEVFAKPFIEVIHPDDREMVIDRHARRMKGEDVPHLYPFRILNRDGNIRWVEVNAVLINWKGKPATLNFLSNITDRKQAEEDLKDGQRTLAILISNLPGFVYRCANDRNWTMEYISDGCREVTGYGPDDFIGNKSLCFNDVIHQDFRDILWEKWQDVLKKKVPFEEEYPIITKDGETRWVWERGTGVFSADDQLLFLEGFITDITKRKQAEKSMLESEGRYRIMFESTGTSMILIEDDTTISMANSEFVRNTGYSPNEIIGRMKWTEIVHPDDLGRMLAQHRLRRESPRLALPGYEFRLKTKSGDLRNMMLTIDVLPGTKKSIASLIDITERKRVESALQESERKYRTIYEDAVFGIYQATPEGRFVSANAAFALMAGYTSPAEFIETIKNIEKQLYVNSEDRQRFIEIITAKGIVKGFEVEFYKKDRSTFWTLLNARAVKDEQGRIIYYEGVSSDITSRKQAEEEKRVLEERLQRAEKMEALGTLAGGVAHDLNNVLGVIVGYAELLLNEVDKVSPIRPRLTKIMNGSEKAAAIVQDLLTLARRGVPGRKIINLNKIIADCQQSPEFKILNFHHPSVKIKTDIEADLLNISGSSVHLEKTIYNLISNASEAMAKGGVVTIKTTNQYLDKPISGYDEIREGDYIVLAVTDTGDGIPSADLQRIFEPFYTKKVMGRSGTGLGLAVVWGTVKDHQGYINVQSEEGGGSTFTLYFPVTREKISVEAGSVSIAAYMGKGETILVVDDVTDQRELATEMLKELNYKVAGVASGEAAIDYIKKNKIDLMVLDMIMDPGMDGLDTYMNVLEIKPKQKAIIVSGFSESDRVHAAHALGAGEYVRKPYVMEKLGLAVRKELDRSI
jgi:PAS domain S-box-containing protein